MKEEKRYQDKKVRKKMDAFKSFLRHLVPAIRIDEKWSEVKPRIGSDFNDLDEPRQIETFDKVIKRILEKREGRDEDGGKRKRDRSVSVESRGEKRRERGSEGEDGELIE